MSRHRNVRNMDYDDYDDEDDNSYYDEEDEYDDGGESYLYSHQANDSLAAHIRFPGEEDALIASGKEYLRSVLGDTFSEKDAEDAIKRCDYDAEKSLQLLLTRDEERKQHSATMAKATTPPQLANNRTQEDTCISLSSVSKPSRTADSVTSSISLRNQHTRVEPSVAYTHTSSSTLPFLSSLRMDTNAPAPLPQQAQLSHPTLVSLSLTTQSQPKLSLVSLSQTPSRGLSALSSIAHSHTTNQPQHQQTPSSGFPVPSSITQTNAVNQPQQVQPLLATSSFAPLSEQELSQQPSLASLSLSSKPDVQSPPAHPANSSLFTLSSLSQSLPAHTAPSTSHSQPVLPSLAQLSKHYQTNLVQEPKTKPSSSPSISSPAYQLDAQRKQCKVEPLVQHSMNISLRKSDLASAQPHTFKRAKPSTISRAFCGQLQTTSDSKSFSTGGTCTRVSTRRVSCPMKALESRILGCLSRDSVSWLSFYDPNKMDKIQSCQQRTPYYVASKRDKRATMDISRTVEDVRSPNDLIFAFDTLSPDDEVLKKQTARTEKKSNTPVNALHTPAHARKKNIAKPKTPSSKQNDTHEVSKLNSDMDGLGLTAPVTPEAPKVVIPKFDKRKKRIDVEAAYQERQKNEKEKVSVVVVGHVDAGKSTLMGHLLYLVGKVDKRTMHKFERESEKIGKSSFAFAWVLDETGEERQRGITVDVAKTFFETAHRDVTLLDAPGHKDFIPNMITGAAQADVAILVVDATNNEFETGFESGGQTREHALLIRSLGVSQLIVVVNKLDTVNWSKDRFDQINGKLKPFLKQVGFKGMNIKYVPCSGLKGTNLVDNNEPKLKAWYSGGTLVSEIDQLSAPVRPISQPLRMSVSDIFKSTVGGASILCTIHCGKLQVGDPIMHMPGSNVGVIKKLEVQEYVQDWAVAGDVVTMVVDGIDTEHVSAGHFFCDPHNPVKCTDKFEAQIVLFDVDVPITRGFPVLLHYQSVNESGYVTKLINQLNKTTGEVIKKSPRVLTRNSTGLVRIKLSRTVCLEEYKHFRELGRFMLRDKGKTIAAGIITSTS
eukprot:CFRG5425T1